MIRAAGALSVLLGSGFLLSALLALGERDWHHCFINQGRATPPLPSLFAPGEFLPFLLETLTPPFSSPLLFALHFGPAALFAAFIAYARSPRARRLHAAGFAAFLLWAAWLLLPPSSQHHCDRTGTGSTFLLFAILAAGWLGALLVNRFNCIAGACRT